MSSSTTSVAAWRVGVGDGQPLARGDPLDEADDDAVAVALALLLAVGLDELDAVGLPLEEADAVGEEEELAVGEPVADALGQAELLAEGVAVGDAPVTVKHAEQIGPVTPSVVFAVTSRLPTAAVDCTRMATCACVPAALTTTDVTSIPVPEKLIRTPRERFCPSMVTVRESLCAAELGVTAVTDGGEAWPMENRHPQLFMLPSLCVRVGT